MFWSGSTSSLQSELLLLPNAFTDQSWMELNLIFQFNQSEVTSIHSPDARAWSGEHRGWVTMSIGTLSGHFTIIEGTINSKVYQVTLQANVHDVELQRGVMKHDNDPQHDQLQNGWKEESLFFPDFKVSVILERAVISIRPRNMEKLKLHSE